MGKGSGAASRPIGYSGKAVKRRAKKSKQREYKGDKVGKIKGSKHV